MPVDPPYSQTRATAAVQMKSDTDCCCFGGGPRNKVLYVHQFKNGPADVEGSLGDVLSVDDTTHMAIVARTQGRVKLPCSAANDSAAHAHDTATSGVTGNLSRLPRPSEQRCEASHMCRRMLADLIDMGTPYVHSHFHSGCNLPCPTPGSCTNLIHITSHLRHAVFP